MADSNPPVPRQLGILFSAPMVNAILDGQKTQTRRLSTFYRPGDLLYVKEHWRVSNRHDKTKPRDLPGRTMTVFYEAGGSAANGAHGWELDRSYSFTPEMMWVGKFRNSMFLPKWASRQWLKVTAVRQERLQDISEDDAKAEGAPMYVSGHGPITQAEIDADPGYASFVNYRLGYEHLWGEINGPESWAANPLVYVISFERIAMPAMGMAA